MAFSELLIVLMLGTSSFVPDPARSLLLSAMRSGAPMAVFLLSGKEVAEPAPDQSFQF